jgi:D-3-phosphoglycerate dehydrogenase
MRILVADKLAPLVPGRLQDLGAEVLVEPDLSGATLTDRLASLDPAVLVVRSTKVTAADVEAARSLSLIIRAGAGVNTIDMKAASGRGVYVANCPGKNACAVAELTIGHLINLDRRIADNVAALRARQWNKKAFGAARGLRGRTLAVLGTGSIGREVIRRAQALGMKVRAWSRSLTPEQAEELRIERAATPERAVEGADAVTVHLALTPETRGRIGEGIFAAMKPGAYFINTSRGELVDHAALARALEDKGIRAGLDVFAVEPSGSTGEFADAIVDHPNVYGTHHIGASTLEAEEAVGEEVVAIVDAYASGRPIPNCVNLASESEATHVLVVRHADRVGVLATVLDRLRDGGHNVQGMENIVFSGGEAACARIEIAGAPSAETLATINADPAIFSASASRIDR